MIFFYYLYYYYLTSLYILEKTKKNNLYKAIGGMVSLIIIVVIAIALGGDYPSSNQTQLSPEGIEANKVLEQDPTLATLFQLQNTYTSDIILQINCTMILDEVQQEFCSTEKARYEEIFSRIGWEDVVNLPTDEIQAFDCNGIYDAIGRSYCINFQQELIKN